MQPMLGQQSSHASVQFLNSILSQRGPNALRYEEEVKWSIRQHLLSVLSDFPGLQVKTGIFTHNDGRSANLLQVDGTIPMYYQDVKYNIPITMWLLETYPRNAPLVYVTPTRDMIIKPRHPCVDASGLVSIPYIQHWGFPRANLVELVQSLSMVFGQDSPLYSRPANSVSPVSPVNPVNPVNPAVARAAPPPMTPSFRGMNPMHSSGGSVATAQPSPLSMAGTPVPPARRTSYPPSPYVQQSSTTLPTIVSRPPPPPQQQLQGTSTSRNDNPGEVFKRNANIFLSERVARDSAVLLRKREAEMEALVNTQALLSQRAGLVDEGSRELQEEKEGLEQQLQLMLTNTDVIEGWLKENDREIEDVDIDEAFEITDALSKQMLECNAGDLAIDDVLYSLDKAVQDGAIPVDAYLKHVRILSREQFIFRATIAKARALQMEAHLTNMASRAGHSSHSSYPQ